MVAYYRGVNRYQYYTTVFRVWTENQMEKKMENEMGTGVILGFMGMIANLMIQDSLSNRVIGYLK